MKKNERGAVVVEASIAFSVFIFAIFIIYSMVTVCLAQAKINVAVNCAAKEISQYCYLYSLTDLPSMQKDAADKAGLANGAVDSVVGGIEAMYDAIGNAPNSSLSDTYNSGKAAYDRIQSGVDTVIEDPKEFILSAAYSAGTSLANDGLGAAGGMLAKAMVKKNLVTAKGGSVEAYLKQLGVVPNGGSYFNGISFEGTEVYPSGEPIIQIVASFDVSVIRLLDTDVKFHICVCGKTKAWSVA